MFKMNRQCSKLKMKNDIVQNIPHFTTFSNGQMKTVIDKCLNENDTIQK